MKAKYYIIFFLISLIGSACERTLDFEDPADESVNDLTINAVAIAGTTLKVYLNHAYLINKTPSMQYYDYDHATYLKDDGTLDYTTNDYYQKTAISQAEVEVVVNGDLTYGMTWSDTELCYVGSYVVREGDHIAVSASFDGQQAKSETTVPLNPQIEVVNYEVRAENPYIQMNGLSFETDTIMRITCRISDTGGNHYFRLRIRGERSLYSSLWVSGVEHKVYYYMMQDIFFSSDELFSDNRLTGNFGGWSSSFSNVFDNSLMDRGSYTFVVDSPKIPEKGRVYLSSDEILEDGIADIPARVMVELQAISPEFYHYLKSVELFRITEADAFSEPVQIYSNVQNGWGIFGALSYDRQFVEYGE